jgi:hypothetical protein
MPSEAAEKSVRRARKKAELLSRIPKSQQGSSPIRLNYEEFVLIIQKALVEIGAEDVNYSDEGRSVSFRTPQMSAGLTAYANLPNLYEKKKFDRPEDCLQGQINFLNMQLDYYAKRSDSKEESMSKLSLTVKTHEFIVEKNDQVSPDSSDHVIFRPFSSNSGELYTAVVIGLQSRKSLTDVWIPSVQLQEWGISEDEAFDLALKNLNRTTPERLACVHLKSIAELQKFLSSRRSILTQITHQEIPKHGASGILHVKFHDSRALPRLLLPRVIERLAEVLRCGPLSVVVVPFEDSEFFAANAEDMASMLMLAIYQTLPFCQGDNIHVKHKVSWNPFKVSFS